MRTGPQPRVDNDVAFSYWYDGGHRRTLVETAEHFGVSYTTCKKYAEDGDWDGRALEIEAEARRIANQKLVALNATAIEREMQMLTALEARFARRLLPTIENDKGEKVPNPDYLAAGDMTVTDALQVIKARVALHEGIVEPLVTGDKRDKSLEELDAEIAALYMAQSDEGGTVDGDGGSTDA